MVTMADTQYLRESWIDIYSKTLPALARNHDPAQPKWPVTLDHCFARIILDNTVGKGREQWDKCLKRPAVKNMSRDQLEKAIELAERIRDGREDLVALDLQSLEVRGKLGTKYNQDLSHISKIEDKKRDEPGFPRNVSQSSGSKRKLAGQGDGEAVAQSLKKTKFSGQQSTLSFAPRPILVDSIFSPPSSENVKVDFYSTLNKVNSHTVLTPYRKRLYAALLSVPEGRYTTYAALSNFLGSSARAVGSGMRNNPFAPEVPCHRVLASDGSIGGFGGSWGIDGKNASKKFDLLKKEGVKFDSNGKVRGPPFQDFVNLLDCG